MATRFEIPRAAHGPWLVVAAAVAWNLVSLRAETLRVSYLDDSSVHAQMVRFATQLIRSGHLPLTSWFPFLGLGSPQFLHYQSLPSMLAGLLGLAVGPGAAFRWTLYLLLAIWPISIYLSARLFGLGRTAAAAAAAMSPFLVSATGIGYEQKAYVWTGFGLWTQLWASVTLPLAWGFSWRAIRHGRQLFAAVALVSLTIALHFETGYLALLPLLLWPLVAGPPILTRVRRAAVLLAGSLLASAWVIVPLIEQRAWAATNETLRGTALVNGYGSGRVLGWLISGQLLDYRRLPVVTLFAAVGLALASAWCRRNASSRALLAALGACLLLSFGRNTFGSLVAVIPGSSDIFLRRFMMGIQLAALLLAGSGAAWSAERMWNALEQVVRARDARIAPAALRRGPRPPRAKQARALLPAGIALLAAIVVLAPAWLQLGSYDDRNAAAITAQRRADATQGAELDRLLGLIQVGGRGRVYAGTPSNWGVDFTVGAVPIFKYLESRDVDEVGYTLRTASLMTGSETHFDELNPSVYQLFGIRYLILPSGWSPPIPAQLLIRAGPYSLWSTRMSGYVHVGRFVGLLTANRMDVGTRSSQLLDSRLAGAGEYLSVDLRHERGALRPLPPASTQPATGTVLDEIDHLDQGWVTATVRMHQPGVAVLSVSFDPGWVATVDGHQRTTQMVAPALVATALSPGTHRIVFHYEGFRDYPELFMLSAVALASCLGARILERP